MKHLDTKIFNKYREMVEKAYPSELENWPVISGYSLRFGKYRGWNILFFEHTGNPIPLKIPLEHLTAAIVGVDDIGSDTELARKKLTRYLRVTSKDMLLLVNARASNLEQELRAAFEQHETLVKKQDEPAPEREITNPPPAPEKVMQLKAVVQVQIQEAPAAEQASPAAELPQKENEQAEKRTTAVMKEDVKEDVKSENQPVKNKVLVVPGANDKMKKSMGNFLLSLGLKAVECAEAQRLTGVPAHDKTGILAKIFEHCQAVVVLLTNDKQDCSLSEKEPELKLLHQADLNALYMAGVSAGINRDRTIVAGFGNPAPYRVIPGLNIIDMDNSLEKRKKLMESIKLAGCEVKTRGKAWHISGDFDIELKPVSAEKQPPPPAGDSLPGQDTKKQQIQPETGKDKPLEKQPEESSPAASSNTGEQPSRGKSLIDSLPIINILKTKKQPQKEKLAPEKPTPSQPEEKADNILKEVITPEPVEKKPPLKKQEPALTSRQPDRESQPKNIKNPIAEPETGSESKITQKTIKENVPKRPSAELPDDEIDSVNRIKELEAKLETLKNRGGRINQRAVDELEKQIQAEKYRMRTIRQLANIENIKKSYEEYNKKDKKDGK